MALIARLRRWEARLLPLALALHAASAPTVLADAPVALQSSALLAQSSAPKGWPTLAVRNEVLRQTGLIAPADLAADEVATLASSLSDLAAAKDPEVHALLQRFPRAEELVFDGKNYRGENFGFIDAIIGLGGRPLAMDREPPVFLLPLARAAEEAFTKKRDAFQTAKESRPIITATARQWRTGEGKPNEALAVMLSAEGELVRPYAGRFDDLYFHLFQNGNGLSGIAFWCMADGLLERRYSPLTGLGLAPMTPERAFDLSDVFSDGGRGAILAWQAAQGKELTSPLRAFAFQIFPIIAGRLGAASAGASVIATGPDYAKFLANRRTLYPLSVPPLFRSPDRFFGRAGRGLMLVANEQRIVLSDADAMFPLPDQSAPAQPQFPGAEDAKSAQLFSSSTTGEMTWEDPAESKLLQENGSSPSADDPRLRPAAQRWVLVISPSVAESAAYRKAIAANDQQLRAQVMENRRAAWIRAQLQTISSTSETPAALIASVRADLATLQQIETRTHAEILQLLRDRFEIRAELEERLQHQRLAPLQPSRETLGLPTAPSAPTFRHPTA